MTGAEPVLAARGIDKSFGALVACRDVSLDLREGEIHALIGPNGAGKSTLVAQIAGSLRPDRGTLRLLGRDVTALDEVARARLGLARTFQVSALALGRTARENAALGALGRRGGAYRALRSLARERALLVTAERALERVGLAAVGRRRAAELSHGERRRLEIAVALAADPAALVMDEPLAGLGADGSAELVPLLDALRAEAPILLVEHDMDAVFALADRVSVLVDGAVVASGPPAAIRRDERVRTAYLGDEASAA